MATMTVNRSRPEKASRRGGAIPDARQKKMPLHWQGCLLTAQEERDLAGRVKAGDPAAREELIVANLPLVIHLSSHYKGCGMTRDDIIQEGVLGLIRAVEKFDPDAHETRLSTYATCWITQMIRLALSRTDSMIRVPEYLWRLQRRFRRLTFQLRNEEFEVSAADQSQPTELAERLGVTARRLALLYRSQLDRGLPRFDEAEEGIGLEQVVPDRYSPERELEQAERSRDLGRAIDTLPAIEAWVIRRRFDLPEGPDGSSPTTPRSDDPRSDSWYDSLGRILGISRFRVARIEQKALRHLREILGSELDPAHDWKKGR